MKKTTLMMALLLTTGMNLTHAQDLEITPADKEIIAKKLNEQANIVEDPATKKELQSVANAFDASKIITAPDMNESGDDVGDCIDCQHAQPRPKLLARIGRTLGKSAAWITTTTAKPFLQASGFMTGLLQKKDKNKDIAALYKFFLNHEKEFDDLYLEAGTPEEMVELMLAKMEEIMEKKSRILLKDFLDHVGLKKELPADLKDFELTEAEIASIDKSKLDPSFINNHKEYQEVRGLLGDVTAEKLQDFVLSGKLDVAFNFDIKETLPKVYELAATVVSQIFVPNMVLGIVSSALAGLYTVPVIAAQAGTAVSTMICLEKTTQDRFESDADLKSFCSYVINRSAYQLEKSRAKGYVAGKGLRAKLEKKLADRKAKRAAKKQKKELEKEQETMLKQLPVH